MLELDKTQKLENKNLTAGEEFRDLCDEFSAFNDYCAFFCESVSLHAVSGVQMDKVCAHGLERFAQALRDKSQHFDNWLQELHVRI